MRPSQGEVANAPYSSQEINVTHGVRATQIAIVGAGPGGLSAAIALSRAGFAVTVYEKHSAVRPLGGAILLNAIGIYILRSYDIDVGDLRPVDLLQFRRYDGHLRVVQRTEPDLSRLAGSTGWISGMMRSELYERMLAVVPNGMVQTGKDLVDLVDTGSEVSLRFADGDSATADIVIGADGINSVVREALWGPSELKHLGIDVWLGWAQLDGPDRDRMLMRHDDLHQFGYAPLMFEGKECFEWWFVEPSEEGRTEPDDPLSYISGKVRRFESPVRELVRASAGDGHLFRWPVKYREPLPVWSRGRVTLLGDASHPTSPYAGYGAGMAIEDGYFLGKYLDGVDLSDSDRLRAALERYDAERVAYTNRVTAFARALGRSFHNASWLARRRRDFMLDWTKIPDRRISDGYQSGAHRLLKAMLDAEAR